MYFLDILAFLHEKLYVFWCKHIAANWWWFRWNLNLWWLKIKHPNFMKYSNKEMMNTLLYMKFTETGEEKYNKMAQSLWEKR